MTNECHQNGGLPVPDPATGFATRRCTQCGEAKPIGGAQPGFQRMHNGGVSPVCKECMGLAIAAGRREQQRLAQRAKARVARGKECSVCGRVRPMAEFRNSKRSPDGKSARCRECGKDIYARRLVARIGKLAPVDPGFIFGDLPKPSWWRRVLGWFGI